jgi:hypothetical protein
VSLIGGSEALYSLPSLSHLHVGPPVTLPFNPALSPFSSHTTKPPFLKPDYLLSLLQRQREQAQSNDDRREFARSTLDSEKSRPSKHNSIINFSKDLKF